MKGIIHTTMEQGASPKNWRDTTAWEAYWTYWISRVKPGQYNTFITPLEAILHIRNLRYIQQRGAKTVLFIGNGLSQLPRAFAHAGFYAVALDISKVATEFARHYQLSQHELFLFFQEDEQGNTGDFVDRYYRPHGKVEFICGDIFDLSIASGTFDAIFSSASLHGFIPHDIGAAIHALDARLSKRGHCFITVRNNFEAFHVISQEFSQLGYVINEEREGYSGKTMWGGVGTG